MNNLPTFKPGRPNGRSLFLAALSAATILSGSSCKKNGQPDGPDGPSNAPQPMVKTILIEGDSSHMISYFYDKQWRVIRTGNEEYSYDEFSYTKDSVIESHRNHLQSPLPYQSYHIGANGTVDLTRLLVDPFWSYRYEYDAEGQMISFKPQDSVSGYHIIEIKCTYKNGNLDSYETISVDNQQITMHALETYEYYLDKANVLAPVNFGRGWFGKGSRNLLRSRTASDGFGHSTIFSWTYEFDAKGRVITELMHFDGRTTQTQYSYY